MSISGKGSSLDPNRKMIGHHGNELFRNGLSRLNELERRFTDLNHQELKSICTDKSQQSELQSIRVEAEKLLFEGSTMEDGDTISNRASLLFHETTRFAYPSHRENSTDAAVATSSACVEELIAPDGHCLFRSALVAANFPSDDEAVAELRKNVCASLAKKLKSKELYPSQLYEGIESENDAARYLAKMGSMTEKMYGGPAELIEIGFLLGVNIRCYIKQGEETFQSLPGMDSTVIPGAPVISLIYVPLQAPQGFEESLLQESEEIRNQYKLGAMKSGHFNVLHKPDSGKNTQNPAEKSTIIQPCESSCARIGYACAAIALGIFLVSNPFQ